MAGFFSDPVVETVDDLTRILALPARPPVDCERDPITKLYPPKTQALITLMTEKYGRGPRLSCACRERVVVKMTDGKIAISRVLPENAPSSVVAPPIVTTVEAFVADNRTCAAEEEAARRVAEMQPGSEITLSSADGDSHVCIKELNAQQAWFLYEFAQVGGALGHAQVGSGKSLSLLLAPLVFPDCKLAVLLIEPNQRQHYASQYLRLREHFRVTSIVFDDRPGYTIGGTPPLHLIAYSTVGHHHHPEVLDNKNPDMILADEAHRLAGKNNSTTRGRVRRYIAKKIRERELDILAGKPVLGRAVRFVPMSGTLEDKSIEDTQPLAAHALGTGSPLPLDAAESLAWSAVFDPSKRPDRTSSTARALRKAFGSAAFDEMSIISYIVGGPEEEIRRGFQKRRAETLGVITARAPDVGAALYFEEREAPPIPETVKAALKMVREDSLRPDGDLIVEQSMIRQVIKEVASGFHYYWAFTKTPCHCVAGGEPKSCDGCKLIREWFDRRKIYGKELRDRLLRAESHLDSPKLCMNAAIRAMEDTSHPAGTDAYCCTCRERWPCGKKTHLPAWVSRNWAQWGEIRNKVPHEKRVRWLDEYLARDAADYAIENRSVIWYLSDALGRKVAQLAQLPCHGGGKNEEALIRAETGKRSVILTLHAWGKGLDGLQHKFSDQLLMEIPSSNKRFEQMLGRLHREGQKADVVTTKAYLHVPELKDSFRRAIAHAEFNQDMSNGIPKLLLMDVAKI